MKTCYFTSITANYLPKARILCNSLKKYNPEAIFFLAISDMQSNQIRKEEPFDGVISIFDLDSIENKKQFIFKHTITELCTAVKPMVAKKIMEENNCNVIYLDPDIAVFDSLSELESFFEKGSILLTPHKLIPEKEDLYVRENEILFLKRGTYNFGFFGVKNDEEGIRFLNCWTDRLMLYCFDDNYEVLDELSRDGLLGLFTDQKWADLIPSFFEKYYIIREPGYNVCTWNLSEKEIEERNGKFFVNNKPLFFYHFSGYDSGAHHSEVDKSLSFYPYNSDVRKLSAWYKKKLIENEKVEFKYNALNMDKYSNGEAIKSFERKIFHIRKDVYFLFKNPFEVKSDAICFYKWIREEYPKYFNIEKKYVDTIKKSWKDIIFPIGSRRRKVARTLYRKMRGYEGRL